MHPEPQRYHMKPSMSRVSFFDASTSWKASHQTTALSQQTAMTDKGAILQHYFIELTVLWMA